MRRSLRSWLVAGACIAALLALPGCGGTQTTSESDADKDAPLTAAEAEIAAAILNNQRMLKELQPLIDADYPDYRIADSTRSGFILQHTTHASLLLDVRLFEVGGVADWPDIPEETVSPEWATIETFFRHADGMEPDPRTDMNYDVDGFVGAYELVRPGPNSVVSAVWLEKTDSHGVETYTVLVARRNRVGNDVEPMHPDHRAYFVRDSKSGKWSGDEFEPVEIESVRY